MTIRFGLMMAVNGPGPDIRAAHVISLKPVIGIKMAYKATLQYNEPLLKRAVFAYWRRSVGFLFPAVAVLMVAILALEIWRGETSWYVGAMGAILTLGVVLAAAVYVVHYRNSLAKFREMGQSAAAFSADESSFTLSSDLGTTTLTWASIKDIWEFREFWLLLFSRAQFVTVPTADLSEEMKAFVLQKIHGAGGKVT